MQHYSHLRATYTDVLASSGELRRLDDSERRLLHQGSLEVLVSRRLSALARRMRMCQAVLPAAVVVSTLAVLTLLGSEFGLWTLPLASSWARLVLGSLVLLAPVASWFVAQRCSAKTEQRRETYRRLHRERWRLTEQLQRLPF